MHRTNGARPIDGIVTQSLHRRKKRKLERERRFLGAHEMQTYLNGASKEGLIVGSAVFQQVAEEYVTRRVQHKKRRLAWRTSRGARRSLGWIPFKARSLQYRGGQVHFQGHALGPVGQLWVGAVLAAHLAHFLKKSFSLEFPFSSGETSERLERAESLGQIDVYPPLE
jgi:hypothetical protein